MHYYTFHPKDYISKTHFLEPMEDLAYRRMLDYIYLNECHLPCDISEIAKRINMRTHSDSIANVLQEFFDLTDDGYMNDRAEQEIAKYQEKSEKARKSANARWNKKAAKPIKPKAECERITNAKQTQSECNANHEPLTTNHEPLTNNKPIKKTDLILVPDEKDIAFELVEFWNENKPSKQSIKFSVWSKQINARLKTFTADEIKTAMLFIINSKWHQNNNQVLIKNVVDSDKRCANVLEKSNQSTDKQGVSNANQQPKQSSSDKYNQMLEEQFNRKYGETTNQTTDYEHCGNVYDMEEDF